MAAAGDISVVQLQFLIPFLVSGAAARFSRFSYVTRSLMCFVTSGDFWETATASHSFSHGALVIARLLALATGRLECSLQVQQQVAPGTTPKSCSAWHANKAPIHPADIDTNLHPLCRFETIARMK